MSVASYFSDLLASAFLWRLPVMWPEFELCLDSKLLKEQFAEMQHEAKRKNCKNEHVLQFKKAQSLQKATGNRKSFIALIRTWKSAEKSLCFISAPVWICAKLLSRCKHAATMNLRTSVEQREDALCSLKRNFSYSVLQVSASSSTNYREHTVWKVDFLWVCLSYPWCVHCAASEQFTTFLNI